MSMTPESPTAQSGPSDRAIAQAFRLADWINRDADKFYEDVLKRAAEIDKETPPAGARDAVMSLFLNAIDNLGDMPINASWAAEWVEQAHAALTASDALQGTQPAATGAVEPDVREQFTEWLAREMPPGTVISNPRWWAPKIIRAFHDYRTVARARMETNTAATGMGEGWEYLTYRVEWQVRSEYVDPYGNVTQVYAKEPFQTKDAAESYRATIAEPHEFVKGRWTPNDCKNGYAVCSISRVEVRSALAAQPAHKFGVGVDVAGDSVAVSVVHREGALDTVIYSEIHPLPAQPAPVVEDDAIKCETCDGVGSFDERLGGEHFSNPKAPCPDCGGHGEVYRAQPAPVVGGDARDLIGQLVSLAAMYDQPLAKNIAERLDALLSARHGDDNNRIIHNVNASDES